MATQFTAVQVSKMKSLRKSGKTIAETAKEIGASPVTVMKYTKKRGKKSTTRKKSATRKKQSGGSGFEVKRMIEFVADMAKVERKWGRDAVKFWHRTLSRVQG